MSKKEGREMVIDGKEYKFHHMALCRGYVSVKSKKGIIKPYKGKFGEGYTVKTHNPNSTCYCYVSYYVA